MAGEIGDLSEDILLDYPAIRIWLAGKGDLHTILHEWTFHDVMKANAVLDWQDAQQQAVEGHEILEREREEAKMKNKRGR